MLPNNHKNFYLSDWQVLPSEGLLTRGDCVEHLEPLAMAVLVYLADRAGEVVSREALEKDVWHGAVVGYDAVTNTVIKLRKALQDDARDPRFIATIPKKGYQLIADIRFEETLAEQDTASVSIPSERKKTLWNNRLTWALAALAGMGMLGLTWIGDDSYRGETERPSIVVLPFANLGDDQHQDYLADGITEDITTDLSRMSDIRVLASSTAQRYKDKQVRPEQVGEELEVKFVLKGSIRQLGEELRVNAQLVDTKTGFNVWAERYDRKVTEVFAVQDEVTQSIVRELALNLSNQEKQRLARQATANLQAYDYFQEGQRFYKNSTRQTNHRAIEMYRKAIELDPAYGRAYGAMAVIFTINYQRAWSDAPVETLDRALQLAKKAVALDDTTPQTWWALGFVYLAHKEYSLAEQAARKSIEVAPNYADGYGLLALINSYLGRAEQAIAINDKGIELNPYYSHEYLATYGLAYYTLAQYQEAIAILEDGHARNPNHVVIKYLLCASYIRVGRQDEAEWLALELQSLTPTANLGIIARTIPVARSDVRQALLADLRAAGLPD